MKNTTSTLYSLVTDKIIERMGQGIIPWRSHFLSVQNQNGTTHRPYTGFNQMLLSIVAAEKNYADPRWLTLNQVKGLGGEVGEKEKPAMVLFWRFWNPVTSEFVDAQQGDDVGNAPETDAPLKAEGEEAEEPPHLIPLLRCYNLFNVAQCRGLNLPPLRTGHVKDGDTIEAAEKILMGVKDRIKTKIGTECFYAPHTDVITMRPKPSATHLEGYYHTFFHEAVHATGHPERLKRWTADNVKDLFQKQNYSREELTAELGASFLSAKAGTMAKVTFDRPASYIQGYIQFLKNDPKAFVVAAARAQKAADLVLSWSLEEKREAAYTDTAAVSEPREQRLAGVGASL